MIITIELQGRNKAMGFFNFLRGNDINQGVKEQKETAGSFLLDVREPDEYRGGHISGSINLPLQNIRNINKLILKKDAPIYVYCHSGGRAAQAASDLKRMGYAQVKNIGGISSWKGDIER